MNWNECSIFLLENLLYALYIPSIIIIIFLINYYILEKKLKINFEISFSKPFLAYFQWFWMTFIVLTCIVFLIFYLNVSKSVFCKSKNFRTKFLDQYLSENFTYRSKSRNFAPENPVTPPRTCPFAVIFFSRSGMKIL